MKHVVNVMRPPEALDERGQLQGLPVTVIKDWPCEIEPLTGSKAQTERLIVPNASHRVTGNGGGPEKMILDKDYMTGGVLGNRELTIEHIADPSMSQLGRLVLTCSEQKFG